MKHFITCLPLICVAVFAAPVSAHDDAAHAMEITDPAWVRATPPNRRVTAAYLGIRNNGDESRRIVAVSSAVAGRAELHTHAHDRESGMVRMRHVDYIEVPVGQTVVLAPGGLHIMLMELDGDLQPGGVVPITLEFDDGSRLAIEAPVRRGDEPAGAGHGGHGHGHRH